MGQFNKWRMILLKKIILILFLVLCSFAEAEDVWVLCQPDSYVNIRPTASKRHSAIGYMECGWKASTDKTCKNGYLHLDSVPTESGDGWINSGYIVYSEPVIRTFRTNIYSTGRVTCWRSIGGNRRCWVTNEDVLTIYAVSEEWSLSNRGFIRTEYIGADYKKMLTDSVTFVEELTWEDDE